MGVERRRFATIKEDMKRRHAHTVSVLYTCGCRTSCVSYDHDDVGQVGRDKDNGASNVK
jgi:hypothetical protein